MFSILFRASWSMTITCLNCDEISQEKWHTIHTTHHASMGETSHLSCVLDRADIAVVLDLGQAPANASRRTLEARVCQRAKLRVLERPADVESFGLSSRTPSIPELGAVFIEPVDLQALTHIGRPLSVVL